MKKIILTLLMLGVASAVFAQVRITGTVTAADDGSPLPFVSVTVKGTSIVVNTDDNGKYSISVPSGSSSLEFAFVGMVSQTIEIGSRSVINAALSSDATNLDEVMVVAYGTVKKSSFSGSATMLNAEKLAQVPAASFDKSMQGQVAGMQVISNSGQPGAGTTFRIRGSGSLISDNNTAGSKSNEPLYVIDGVAITSEDFSKVAESATSSTNALSSINPQDIESITILKDAAAASLYGSRAANGVVVITTKSGKRGSGKVNFSAQYGISKLSKAYDLMNSAEYYRTLWPSYYQDAVNNSSVADKVDYANKQIQGSITFNPYSVAHPYDANGNLDPNARIIVDTDWQDAIFKTGYTQDYNLSFSGANDNTSYFVSAAYYNQDGITPSADFKRYSGRANVASQIKKWMNVGINTTFSHSIQNTEVGGGAGASPLYNALTFPNGVPIYLTNPDGSYQLDSKGNKQYNWLNGVAKDFNPVATPGMDIWRTKTYRFLASTFLEVNIVDGLKFKTTFAPDYTSLYETRFWNMEHGNGPAYKGRSERHQTHSLMYTTLSTLNYMKTFGEVHNFSAMLGQEAWERTTEYALAQGTTFPFPGLIELDNAAAALNPGSYTNEEAMISYIARGEYNFANKYYASLSYRRDGSSRFGVDNRWGNFWSVGGSWRLEQENFMKDVAWVDALKLRVSYGTSGNNQNLREYQAKGLWTGKQGTTSYNYGARPGFMHYQLANRELGWEAQKMFNIGVDFSLLRRISGSVEYFHKVSDGLLYKMPLAYSTGFSSIVKNMAKVSNSGVEFDINATAVQTRDFTWNVSLNFAAIKDEIKELYEGKDQQEIADFRKIWEVGGSQYEFYLPTWAGVDASNGNPLWYVVDANGSRTTTNEYSKATKQKQGRATPDCFGGFTNSLSYKGFDLSIFLYYSLGGKVYDGLLQQVMHDGNSGGKQLHKDGLNAWTPTNTITNVPRYSKTGGTMSNNESTRFLYDATYIKLKNVTLSYTLPQKWAQASGILAGAKVYVSVDNIATWFKDDWKGYDDIDIFGIGGFNAYPSSVPLPRTITMGVNLTF